MSTLRSQPSELVADQGAPPSRRQDIEILRILGSLGIVWAHSTDMYVDFAYSGLIVFLLLSMYLSDKRGSADIQTLRRRFTRLILPWMIWFTVYGLVNMGRGKPFLALDRGLVAGMLSGTSIHLWYMPFVFFCLMALDVAKGHLSGSTLGVSSAMLGIAGLLTTPLWRPASIDAGYPMAQWAHASIAVFIGIFFLYYDKIWKPWAYILALAMLLASMNAFAYKGVGIPYFIGILAGLLIASEWLATWQQVDFSAMANCTFGIYLVHVLVVSAISKMKLTPHWLLPIAGFILSMILVATMRRVWPRVARYWS